MAMSPAAITAVEAVGDEPLTTKEGVAALR